MRVRIWIAGLGLALAGCAGNPNAPTATPSTGTVSPIGVIGTPVLLVAKIPACAVTALFAAPLAAASVLERPDPALAPLRPDEGASLRADLDDGLIANCGPPYVVTRQ